MGRAYVAFLSSPVRMTWLNVSFQRTLYACRAPRKGRIKFVLLYLAYYALFVPLKPRAENCVIGGYKHLLLVVGGGGLKHLVTFSALSLSSVVNTLRILRKKIFKKVEIMLANENKIRYQ